jgi:hypothetical protein
MPDVTSSAGMPPFIGRFRILRVLGSGAQSTVYAAFDPHLHREVALKALHLVGDQTEAATAMLHEARAVSRLSHPAIVPVFDAGEEGGQPYLVFEYVPGQTLAARLHITGSLPAERAVALLLPILEALAYTHEHQVVHRDLKPTNIRHAGPCARDGFRHRRAPDLRRHDRSRCRCRRPACPAGNTGLHGARIRAPGHRLAADGRVFGRPHSV